MLSELHKVLQLTQEQICVLAALLGNFILPESELQDLYRRMEFATGMKDGEVCIILTLGSITSRLKLMRSEVGLTTSEVGLHYFYFVHLY